MGQPYEGIVFCFVCYVSGPWRSFSTQDLKVSECTTSSPCGLPALRQDWINTGPLLVCTGPASRQNSRCVLFSVQALLLGTPRRSRTQRVVRPAVSVSMVSFMSAIRPPRQTQDAAPKADVPNVHPRPIQGSCPLSLLNVPLYYM